MFDNLIFLMAGAEGGGAADAPAGQSPLSFLIMVGGIIVVFYFFMIRPQQRKQKAEQKFREGLKKGDKVLSIGGIHGRVASVEDNGIFVEVDNGVKLKFDKTALRAAPEDQANTAKK
jgi:preprotein translocase subunit YajC